MKEDKDFELFNKAAKLTLLLQCSLELMDEMKGLKMYRQDIRNLMNTLERKVELHLRKAIDEMGRSDEFIMMQIQRGIDSILESTLEEIHNHNLEEK
jgi:hypothetical protein